MNRRTVKTTATSLTTRCWLVVSNTGAVRTTATQPAVQPWEVAIRIDITLPKMLFARPTLAATIDIPADAAPPPEITAETVGDIRDAVLAATGMELRIEVISSELANAG